MSEQGDDCMECGGRALVRRTDGSYCEECYVARRARESEERRGWRGAGPPKAGPTPPMPRPHFSRRWL